MNLSEQMHSLSVAVDEHSFARGDVLRALAVEVGKLERKAEALDALEGMVRDDAANGAVAIEEAKGLILVHRDIVPLFTHTECVGRPDLATAILALDWKAT